MNCPACNHVMSQKQVGGVTVDTCDGGCGGLWFDAFEFKKFDEPHESQGEALLDIPANPNAAVNPNQRKCPKCKTIVMRRFFASVLRQVEIDECGNCAGVFLDAHELRTIRSQFPGEAERVKAANEYFTKHFDAELVKFRNASAENATKARLFARIFRFICPSAYIPGKQDGGAW